MTNQESPFSFSPEGGQKPPEDEEASDTSTKKDSKKKSIFPARSEIASDKDKAPETLWERLVPTKPPEEEKKEPLLDGDDQDLLDENIEQEQYAEPILAEIEAERGTKNEEAATIKVDAEGVSLGQDDQNNDTDLNHAEPRDDTKFDHIGEDSYSSDELAGPQHAYNWDDTEASQSHHSNIEHEVSPPVASVPEKNSNNFDSAQNLLNEPSEYVPVPDMPVYPVFEQVQNPYLVAAEIAAHEGEHHPVVVPTRNVPEIQTERWSSNFGLGIFVATAAYLLGRRRGKRTVKSQEVKQANFEHTPAVSNTNVEAPAVGNYPDHTPSHERIVEFRPTNAVEFTGYERRTESVPINDASSHPEKASQASVTEGRAENVQERTYGPRLPERTMQRAELLALAKSIRVDSVSVHEMFSAKRIDEDGLHRIVVEFLRGGDLKKVIAQEVIRQQIRFERDPQLRGNPVETLEDRKARAKRAVGLVKQQTIELLDLKRAKDRTERVAEFMQKEVILARDILEENPQVATVGSVLAIIIIYATIIGLILSN